ncbi:sensor histidine kinase [Maribellus mangrovi]|uniref:sensor histidine kinase n=1 Tax=Maribellus mangrovi TaxID=3133146 RepID=UPI0030EE8A6F
MKHPTANKTVRQKVIWHLLVLAGAVGVSALFSLILFQKIIHSGLLNMLVLTFLQLELFLWLGYLFFYGVKPDAPGVIKTTLIRFILFYLTVLAVAFMLYVSLYTYHFIRSGSDFSQYLPSLFSADLKFFFNAVIIGFGLGALFFFYSQWTDALKSMQKLREEKLIFQYETLKSQVNPHFLFNSLNTLSSLVRKDVDLSEEFILKLSSVYRYVLENQDKDLVPLKDELAFVNDFFALQKVRDQEKIELQVESNGQGSEMIVPVSLQMLVENALKHNVASRKEPLRITIHYEGLDKIVVRNNLQEKEQLGTSSGIGLKNLDERCRLILDREIEIVKTQDEFVVKLPLNP